MEIIHQGWLEFWSESTTSRSWMKLSKKLWKRKYIVLYYLSEDTDKVFLGAYEKDNNWHGTEPKKILELFPRYRIAKLQNYKGKDVVLEVNNEREQWYFTSEKSKFIDLWATQIQMQTKLSRSISGRIFSVSGAVDKQMQKIGAAQQRCLLHFTRWGITLALQDSRAILAMWPMKTIRNFESLQCKFSVEAGRKAPMGEGLFVFHTNIGQDEEMFQVMDAFITAGLNEKAEIRSNKKEPSTDEEILRIYDALHRAAIGINHETPINHDQPTIDIPGYAPLGKSMVSSISQDSISINKPPDYNHLFNISTKRRYQDKVKDETPQEPEYNTLFNEKGKCMDDLSSPNYHGRETPRGLSFSDHINVYDTLNKQSWDSQFSNGYDQINRVTGLKQDSAQSSAYEKINHIQQGFSVSIPVTSTEGRNDHNSVGFPLRDQPSVPFLNDDDDNNLFVRRSPLSKTPDDQKYEFRNSIYVPTEEGLYENNVKEKSQSPLEKSYAFRNSIYTPADEDFYVNKSEAKEEIDTLVVTLAPENSDHLSQNTSAQPMEHESNGSVNSSNFRRRQNVRASFKEKPIQDIADHFLYQMPSSFSPKNDITTAFSKVTNEYELPVDNLVDENDTYQNTDSAKASVFQDSPRGNTQEFYQNSDSTKDDILLD